MLNIDTNNDGHTRKAVGGDKKGFPETRGLENQKTKTKDELEAHVQRAPRTHLFTTFRV